MTLIADVSRKRVARVSLVLLLALSFPIAMDSQTSEGNGGNAREHNEVPSHFLDRWAFKTNAIEWMLTIPNFNVEFELLQSPYNRWTLGLEAKYNWNTYHKHVPSVVFNHFDIRPEFRYYFRQKAKQPEAVGIRDSVKHKAPRPPKPWRAYFIGGYADFATYAFKFSPKGIQGKAAGFGATAGYAIPLYLYNKGAVDIEFSFSAGFVAASMDKFYHNPNGDCYVKYDKESKGWHFVPYPVVSEIKVAFAWRHLSIKDKYIKEDPRLEKIAKVEKDIKASFINASDLFAIGIDAARKAEYDENPLLKFEHFTTEMDNEFERIVTQVLPNSNLSESDAKSLEKRAVSARRKTVGDFRKEWKKEYGVVMKEKDALLKAQEKDAKAQAREAKRQEKKAKAQEKKFKSMEQDTKEQSEVSETETGAEDQEKAMKKQKQKKPKRETDASAQVE